jgi:hypothetical protein
LIHPVLFGGTGMVGAGVLLECLEDSRVQSVLAIGRSPTGRTHPKLREILGHDDGAPGRAMITVAESGFDKRILHPREINALAGA